jgi:NAD(P)-dependent dehydrogenase (short-subunit alcohol dehydrogenase family)
VRTVLVTGGAKRLGWAISEHLAETGWHVIIHCNASIDQAQALQDRIRARGGVADIVRQDLFDTAHCADLITRAADAAGRPLTALVNNAAIFDFDTALDVSFDLLEAHWKLNLAAPLMLSAAFAKQVVAADNPSIVHITDQKVVNPNPDFYSYTASKAALAGMIAPMTMGFAGKCRVNAVAPGALLPSFGLSDDKFDQVSAENPMGKPIALSDVARTVAFLLESGAVNGEMLFAANGQQWTPSKRDVMFNAG